MGGSSPPSVFGAEVLEWRIWRSPLHKLIPYNWVVADQFPGLQLEYIIYSEVFVGHITFPLVSTIKLGTGWEGRT